MDKLDEFFENIADRSITVRKNFRDDTYIGMVDMQASRRHSDIGFLFYTHADAEIAARTGTLYISWGAYSMDDEIDYITVADAIVDEARACKLDASWKGGIHDRIVVKNVSKEYFN